MLQQDLDMIYKWAEENFMEFNENKFEKMSHGKTSDIEEGLYRTGSGKEIKSKKNSKRSRSLDRRRCFL